MKSASFVHFEQIAEQARRHVDEMFVDSSLSQLRTFHEYDGGGGGGGGGDRAASGPCKAHFLWYFKYCA